MSPARNTGLEDRVSDLFGLLYETSGKLGAIAAQHESFRARLDALERWIAAYPEKLQTMLNDASREHRALEGGIARLDGELRLLAERVAAAVDEAGEAKDEAEKAAQEARADDVAPKIAALEAKLKALRRPPARDWEKAGKAIAGILIGVAGVGTVIAGALPLVEWIIVNVFGP